MTQIEEPNQDENQFLSLPTLYGAIGAVAGTVLMVFVILNLSGWDSQDTFNLALIAAVSGLAGALFGYKIRRRAFLGGFVLGLLLSVPVMNAIGTIRALLA